MVCYGAPKMVAILQTYFVNQYVPAFQHSLDIANSFRILGFIMCIISRNIIMTTVPVTAVLDKEMSRPVVVTTMLTASMTASMRLVEIFAAENISLMDIIHENVSPNERVFFYNLQRCVATQVVLLFVSIRVN